MARTLTLLQNSGYDPFFKVLNASDFGIPQKRERLYFVCFRKDLGVSNFQFPEPIRKDVAVEDVLLPPTDSLLEGLFIEREDLSLVKELPAIQGKPPPSYRNGGEGRARRESLQSKGACHYFVSFRRRNRGEDRHVFD